MVGALGPCHSPEEDLTAPKAAAWRLLSNSVQLPAQKIAGRAPAFFTNGARDAMAMMDLVVQLAHR